MTESLFELASEYDHMVNQGLKFSGEDRHYFIRGRIADLVANLPEAFSPKRVLDFGCGTGDAAQALHAAFPGATVVGADSSKSMIDQARSRFDRDGIGFIAGRDLIEEKPFDLCYINNVFHHVEPEHRSQLVKSLRGLVAPGAYQAVFETNPYNPGTRLVMSRIPFDKDAKVLRPRRLERLVKEAGFNIVTTRFLFYFPGALSFLRRLEARMVHVPLGAQYWVLARRAH